MARVGIKSQSALFADKPLSSLVLFRNGLFGVYEATYANVRYPNLCVVYSNAGGVRTNIAVWVNDSGNMVDYNTYGDYDVVDVWFELPRWVDVPRRLYAPLRIEEVAKMLVAHNIKPAGDILALVNDAYKLGFKQGVTYTP